ncbi:MAG: MATE family efflux transporter, partial [Desulfovibrio sp.]|nr:MATE family efflux transporter [Desulfovibrio sp.]
MAWPGAHGFRQVLGIGLPLMASMAGNTLMHLADRVFLGGYSLEALAAAGAAGQVNFLCLAFFLGVAGYLNVFVAQFVGAGQFKRVGSVVWLGVYFACAAQAALALVSLLTEPIFTLAGHAPQVAAQEIAYFRLLTLGGGLFVAGPALGAFFSGRGRTRPVMLANLLGVACFLPLDYALIYGWGPFPELGIVGSACAAICQWAIVAVTLAALIMSRRHDQDYGLKQGRAWDRSLFAALWRQGLGGGLQFAVE